MSILCILKVGGARSMLSEDHSVDGPTGPTNRHRSSVCKTVDTTSMNVQLRVILGMIIDRDTIYVDIG